MNPREPFKKSDEITAYLTEVLRTIRTGTEDNFQTDIGQTVYRGRLKHDEDKVPYCSILEGEDRVTSSGIQTDVTVAQDFVIGAYVPCDPRNPNDAAHEAIRDIKKAIFTSDLAFRSGGAGSRGQGFGRVKTLEYGGKDIGPRADGAPIVYCVVYITVTFVENLLDA